jgi:hypothetical protein
MQLRGHASEITVSSLFEKNFLRRREMSRTGGSARKPRREAQKSLAIHPPVFVQ